MAVWTDIYALNTEQHSMCFSSVCQTLCDLFYQLTHDDRSDDRSREINTTIPQITSDHSLQVLGKHTCIDWYHRLTQLRPQALFVRAELKREHNPHRSAQASTISRLLFSKHSGRPRAQGLTGVRRVHSSGCPTFIECDKLNPWKTF